VHDPMMQQKRVWFLADDWKECGSSLNASRPEDELEEVTRVIHKEFKGGTCSVALTISGHPALFV